MSLRPTQPQDEPRSPRMAERGPATSPASGKVPPRALESQQQAEEFLEDNGVLLHEDQESPTSTEAQVRRNRERREQASEEVKQARKRHT